MGPDRDAPFRGIHLYLFSYYLKRPGVGCSMLYWIRPKAYLAEYPDALDKVLGKGLKIRIEYCVPSRLQHIVVSDCLN